MCNLNLLIRAKSVKDDNNKIAVFMQNVTASSYATNSDGDGVVFDDGQLFKGVNKLNYLDLMALCDSRFILSHQRKSTHGLHEKYTQPFINKEFAFMHNGVISSFVMKDNEHSDSFNAFESFLSELKRLSNERPTVSRENNITTTIINTFEDCNGWYSIALYDIKEKKLYYFKNSLPSIHCYITKGRRSAFITTSENNNVYFGATKEVTIEDGGIYCITSEEDKVKITKVCKITEKVTTSSYTYRYGITEYPQYIEPKKPKTSHKHPKSDYAPITINGITYFWGECSYCESTDYIYYDKRLMRRVCDGCAYKQTKNDEPIGWDYYG